MCTKLAVGDELQVAAGGRGHGGAALVEQRDDARSTLRAALVRLGSVGSPMVRGYSVSMAVRRSSAISAMTSGSWIDLAMWWMK